MGRVVPTVKMTPRNSLFPHNTDVSLVYDDAGRKTSMTDGSGTTGWTYDNANRVTQIAQPNGTVTYGYDNANRRTRNLSIYLG